MKLAADAVLSEVRKKQADAKRMLDILKSLEKLRKLRKEAAARKGERISLHYFNVKVIYITILFTPFGEINREFAYLSLFLHVELISAYLVLDFLTFFPF